MITFQIKEIKNKNIIIKFNLSNFIDLLNPHVKKMSYEYNWNNILHNSILKITKYNYNFMKLMLTVVIILLVFIKYAYETD